MTAGARREPVETKVWAASLLSLAVAATVAVLNAAVADSDLLGLLPAWLQAVIVVVVPPVVTFLAGYAAPHTGRPVIGTPEDHP